MKKWIPFGLGFITSAGGIAYYLYYKSQHNKNESKIDASEILSQCLVEGMKVFLKYYEHGIQIESSKENNKSELRKALRKKGLHKL